MHGRPWHTLRDLVVLSAAPPADDPVADSPADLAVVSAAPSAADYEAESKI